MAKKEFTYRGKTLEQLHKLSIEEFARLIGADNRRCLLRGLTEVQKCFLKKIQSGKNKVKTHSRDMVILPIMVGKEIQIHMGKKFESVWVTEEMLGHRLGEFAMTRKKVSHNAPGIGATKSTSSVSVK